MEEEGGEEEEDGGMRRGKGVRGGRRDEESKRWREEKERREGEGNEGSWRKGVEEGKGERRGTGEVPPSRRPELLLSFRDASACKQSHNEPRILADAAALRGIAGDRNRLQTNSATQADAEGGSVFSGSRY